MDKCSVHQFSVRWGCSHGQSGCEESVSLWVQDTSGVSLSACLTWGTCRAESRSCEDHPVSSWFPGKPWLTKQMVLGGPEWKRDG